jgi:predicted nucleic acid-binding protein
VLDIAARKWQFTDAMLEVLARSLVDMGIDVRPVDIHRVASWSGQGLSAYDAAYVAVAEELGAPFLTDDAELIDVATDVALPLATYA